MLVQPNCCIICFILFATCGAATLKENKVEFCGRKLEELLTEVCLVYYIPPEYRVRRQVVTECCHTKCTLDYLVTNYCKSINSEGLKAYLNKQQEAEYVKNNQTGITQQTSTPATKKFPFKYLQKSNKNYIRLDTPWEFYPLR